MFVREIHILYANLQTNLNLEEGEVFIETVARTGRMQTYKLNFRISIPSETSGYKSLIAYTSMSLFAWV